MSTFYRCHWTLVTTWTARGPTAFHLKNRLVFTKAVAYKHTSVIWSWTLNPAYLCIHLGKWCYHGQIWWRPDDENASLKRLVVSKKEQSDIFRIFNHTHSVDHTWALYNLISGDGSTSPAPTKTDQCLGIGLYHSGQRLTATSWSEFVTEISKFHI